MDTVENKNADINNKCIYDLYGVVNHFGSVGFGHYTAYCHRWRLTCSFMLGSFVLDNSLPFLNGVRLNLKIVLIFY